MTTTTKGIAAKMVSVMGELNAVTKSGYNKKQDYHYVRAADVANEVRSALVKHGVAFTYDVESERQWEKPTNSGGTLFFCSLMVRGTFTDKESGESLSGRAVGWGADSLDKAPYKAMTGALKYLLRMNGIIPDEEDPEKDNEHDSPTAVTAAKPTPQSSAERVPASRPEQPKAPAPSLDADTIRITVEKITSKGTKNGGTQWGFKDSEGKWWNTFDPEIGAYVKEGKTYTFKLERKGQYVNIVDIPSETAPAPATFSDGTMIDESEIPF